jgi:hypothetical protein
VVGRAGDYGPRKLDRQSLFFACAAVAREASASPHAKGNKKAQSHHPRCLGQWPTAPTVDSIQARLQLAASERRVQFYFVLSRI